MIKKLLSDGDLVGTRGIVNAFQKVYEHRNMMIISMTYVKTKWQKAMKVGTDECISAYAECCDIANKWVRMVIKYELCKKKEILERILKEIPDVYEKEYNCLNGFVNDCIDWDKFHDYYV